MTLITFGVVVPNHPATAQAATHTFARASVGPAGEGDGPSPQDLGVDGPNVAVSADGRYVAFSSDATNLVANDTNGATDVFRYDRQTGEVTIVSVSDDGAAGDGPSGLHQVDISADGHVVVFESLATTLTDDDFFNEAPVPHVFAVDVPNSRTVLVSAYDQNEPFFSGGIHPSISADGRFVVFDSEEEGQGVWHQELLYGEGGLVGIGGPNLVVFDGRNPSISGDGRYVAFTAPDFQFEAPLDQVYRQDLEAVNSGARELMSASPEGRPADGNSRTVGPRAISDDGQRVGFVSDAFDLASDPDLIAPDGWDAAYVRVLDAASPFTAALPVADGQIEDSSAPSLSRDGRFAAFSSPDDLTGDAPTSPQVYVAGVDDGSLTLASAAPEGPPGNAASGDAVLDGDGRVVAFGSDADNLVADDGNGVTDVFVRVARAGIPPADVSLTVEPTTGGSGIPEVDLAEVDISAMPLFPGELTDTSLQSAPLRFTPLRFTPLRFTPLRFTPLRFTPLRFTPLRFTPLPPMPLSTVPLLTEGGWEEVLAGPPATPYAGLPLQSVLLQEVLALPEGDYPQIDALRFEDVDISSTPLRSTSLQTFLFSGVALDDLSATADWCGALAPDFVCAEQGIDEATSTLVDLHFTGAPVDDLNFVPTLPVSGANLAGSPAYAYDVGQTNVALTTLGAIPADELPPGFVDCTAPATFDCTTATLADAVAGGHIIDYAHDAADPAILGRLLADPTLVAYTQDLQLQDVVRMLIDPAKLSFADLALAPVLLGTPVEGNLIRYTASADVACEAMPELEVAVTLPPGFRYAPGSTTLDVDGERTAWADPILDPPGGIDVPRDEGGAEPSLAAVSRQGLTWPVWGQGCAGGTAHVALAFEAQPWVVLGTQTSSLTFTADGSAVTLPHAAPFSVRDAREPDDPPAAATPVREGKLYLPHLDSGDRTDVFEVEGSSGFARGTIVTAQLSHLPADFDMRLDGPSAAPINSPAHPARRTVIEDHGLSEDPAGDVVPPDRVEDVAPDDDTLSHSINRGLADEAVSTVVTAATAGEPVTLHVSGYLGASGREPYALQVFVEEPPELNCVPQTAFAGGARGSLPAPGSLDPDTRTLVLVNQARFDALHGAGSTQGVRDAFAALDGDEDAGPIAILPVDGDDAVHAAYGAWDGDPCEPELANDVVREIVRVRDDYVEVLDELRFVVMVGDDNIVPSARVSDLVTLGNQRDYYPEVVFDGQDNPQSAAAGYGYVLSDNAYTTLASTRLLGSELSVPALAGGRLVETPAEIVDTIDRYATNPFLDVEETLVTAYDFLLHGGEQTQAALAGMVDAGEARSRLDNEWSVEDLETDELPREPDIAAIFGHYDHSRLLTAAGDDDDLASPIGELLSTTDVLAAGLAEGALLFTVGCNAGLNVPALAWPGATPAEAERLLDWAQAVATRDGTLFANTGFGYGDTTISAYSERLMALFAELLDGSMTVGQAAVAARKAYLAEAPLDVYTAKVVTESTLYGLPFVRVGAAGEVAPPPAQADPGEADTAPVATDSLTGLPATAFSVDPEFQTRTGPRGSYYQAELDGEDQPVLAAISRPLQPAVALGLPATPDGLEVGDLLVTELSTAEDQLDDPVFVRPTFDHSENEPEPHVLDVSYPVSLGDVTPAGNLLLAAGQFRSRGLDEGSQTTYTHVGGSVLYVDASEPAPDRPLFTEVQAARFEGSVSVGFTVEVSPAELVLVLYKPVGEAGWRSLQLAETAPGLWTGGVADVEIDEYFVQAVNGGLVGSARGKGHNFEPQTAADPEGFAFAVEGEPGNNGWYRSAVTVTLADTTPGVVYEASLNGGGFSTIDPESVSVPRDGVNTLEARGSDGSSGMVFVPVDTTAPTVEFVFPADGQQVPADQMDAADFRCADVGSGVDLCLAPEPLSTQEGTHTFRVQARDVAGNVVEQQISYEVVPGDGPCPVDVPQAPFTDHAAIPAVHAPNVDCAAALGIVQGFPDGEYKPRLPVTRAQMASFIFRTLQAAQVELPQASGQRFADVGAGSAHDEAIHRLAAAGIVQGGPLGMDADFYGPQLRTRRDQMASFLMRAAGYALEGDPDFFGDESGGVPRFPDVPSTNTHFGNVNAASDVQIAQGYTDGLYRPRSTTSRDQMASFVVRLLEFLDN